MIDLTCFFNVDSEFIKSEIAKWAEVVKRAAAQRLLAPQFAEVIHATADPFFQPIYDLESSRQVFGRLAILGDAAFVARPHVGMGVTKTAGDAVALVDRSCAACQ